MITEFGNIQIIDFGVAATMDSWDDKRSSFIGTFHYMGPEFYKRDPTLIKYGKEVQAAHTVHMDCAYLTRAG